MFLRVTVDVSDEIVEIAIGGDEFAAKRPFPFAESGSIWRRILALSYLPFSLWDLCERDEVIINETLRVSKTLRVCNNSRYANRATTSRLVGCRALRPALADKPHTVHRLGVGNYAATDAGGDRYPVF